MSYFNIVAQSNESTVVSEYKPEAKRSEAYQSETELEKQFINLLTEQGYEYLHIHEEKDLVDNLRAQLEALNSYKFSDSEWTKFFAEKLAKSTDEIVEKTRIIQEDYIQNLIRDDGSTKNITLIDKRNIHNNRLQVINQYVVTDGARDNRYDITILVNGFPLVHIELKRRGIQIKEAFNQINRYLRDSFWAGSGLFKYVQIFVISNGTNTKYYSNSTRYNHIKEGESGARKGKTSNSFEFTSFWADANNRTIKDLIDFTKTFFSKHTLLNILTKYCVFTAENMLLVMRPYQIVATERILNRIEIANNYKKFGNVAGGGYVWHTTGSGKTLTSFKTARLASDLPYIDKVLFVVDRKDLDYQTMREYDRFEQGAANSNTSTAVLQRQLEDKDNKGRPHIYKIIITTIQKLSTFIAKNKIHPIYDKRIVIIFDECHRSQFGTMHTAITGAFKKYHLFGFTGTPIFALNAGVGKNPSLKTTEQAFGDCLHKYTIVDAINDRNVLPFRVDYVGSITAKENIEEKYIQDIDREKAYMAPKRVENVVSYILEHFAQKTKRNEKAYQFRQLVNVAEIARAKSGSAAEELKNKVMLSGFNSIFAVSSVEAAKIYYKEFKKQMAAHPEKSLKIALIYSFAPNEEEEGGLLGEENSDDTSGLDQSSRDFLDYAIKEYNDYFGTTYDTSSDKFPNYYKDVSLRMKNKQIDLLIVVNMFLTGFDATTLNTLWVDKNLKMHGLVQAFSRTNRILNSIKTFGNIVCFRNLQKRVDDAIALFGDKEASGIVLMKGYKDYYFGYTDEKGNHKSGYVDMIDELTVKFPFEFFTGIMTDKDKKAFISLFGAILKMRNLLSSFDEFKGQEIISDFDFQDYCSEYLDIRADMIKPNPEKENIIDDVVFEMELIKQIEINIDYILILVQKYHDSHCQDKEVRIAIEKAIDSSPELRSKKALIENFINGINEIDDVMAEWRAYIAEEKEKELQKIIAEEGLKPEETRKYIANCFRDGEVKTTGTDIANIMPPVSLFGGGDREKKKQSVIQRISAFFERFFGIG